MHVMHRHETNDRTAQNLYALTRRAQKEHEEWDLALVCSLLGFKAQGKRTGQEAGIDQHPQETGWRVPCELGKYNYDFISLSYCSPSKLATDRRKREPSFEQSTPQLSTCTSRSRGRLVGNIRVDSRTDSPGERLEQTPWNQLIRECPHALLPPPPPGWSRNR